MTYKDPDTKTMIEIHSEFDARLVDRYSVHCYFCGDFVDERESVSADEFNGNDGGSMCEDCHREGLVRLFGG
jgi:hypothetical protein